MLVAVGLDRSAASVDDREVLEVGEQHLDAALAAWGGLDGVDEVAVLSTGCRVEAYAATRFPAVAGASLRAALEHQAGRALPLFELHGPAAFRHLVRVASSLESAILGEPRILGRVEEAFAVADEEGAAGCELAGVLAHVLHAARRVRTETAIGRAEVSWGHAAATLAEKVLGRLDGRGVLVLGAGEAARLPARHLAAQGAHLTVLDPTPAHAEALAGEVGGRHGGLEALGTALEAADLVVSTTPAAPPELHPDAVAGQMARRRRRLVLVDLAVPRAVPEATGALEDVFLCDVDDLDRLQRAALAGRADAAEAAGRIVEAEVLAFARGARLEVPARPRGGPSEGALLGAAARVLELGDDTHQESAGP